MKYNLLSIEWFVINVYKVLKNAYPDCSLTIIGRVDSKDKEALNEDGIEILGYVEEIDSYYRDSCCFICPILYGAGVKVKTIDALSKGCLVITNTKGTEGTKLEPYKHLVVEDQPTNMVNAIKDLFLNTAKYEQIANEGLNFIKNNHSIQNQALIIESRFNKLKNG